MNPIVNLNKKLINKLRILIIQAYSKINIRMQNFHFHFETLTDKYLLRIININKEDLEIITLVLGENDEIDILPLAKNKIVVSYFLQVWILDIEEFIKFIEPYIKAGNIRAEKIKEVKSPNSKEWLNWLKWVEGQEVLIDDTTPMHRNNGEFSCTLKRDIYRKFADKIKDFPSFLSFKVSLNTKNIILRWNLTYETTVISPYKTSSSLIGSIEDFTYALNYLEESINIKIAQWQKESGIKVKWS